MDIKLSFKERFFYSIANLAFVLVWTSISAFIVIFYTDVAMLPAAWVGIFVLLSRIFDGIIDFFIGILVDRGKSPKGKARPWLLRMALPFGVAAVLCFTAFPEWPLGLRMMYAIVTYNIMTTFVYSMIDLPYNALSAAMTQDQYERSVLNVFRLFMAIVGGLIVNVAVPLLTTALGGGPQAWTITFAIFGAVASILIFLSYLNTKERVTASVIIKDDIPVKTAFKALLKNKYWIMIVLYAVISYTSSALSGIGAFFAREILGDFALIGTITIFGVVPMFVASFVLSPIVKRVGKRNTSLIGIFCVIFGCLLVGIVGPSLPVVFVSSAFRAFGGAFIIGTLFALINDTIEYGEWKSGVRTEGLVSTASAFGGNVGNGLGVAIVSLALSVGGYVAREVFHSGPTGQAESALAAINFVYIWLPIILSVGMAALMFFYKLDKEYPAILEELKARQTQNEEATPAEQEA
jgi:GPH family glycoside/pentoside/hexuronide:cation symporter